MLHRRDPGRSGRRNSHRVRHLHGGLSCFCMQWTQCDGWDLNLQIGCICGIANWPGQGGGGTYLCERKPSGRELFAAR